MEHFGGSFHSEILSSVSNYPKKLTDSQTENYHFLLSPKSSWETLHGGKAFSKDTEMAMVINSAQKSFQQQH
jgi:hypothetical protein